MRLLVLSFAGVATTACSLSFGTVGTWTPESPPRFTVVSAAQITLPDGEALFLGGFDSDTGQSLQRVVRFDPRSNRWSQAAPIPAAVAGYATAVLGDGSVLLAGGFEGHAPDVPVAATWVYSPQHDSWKRSGNLRIPRSDAVAVLLSDGRVLIAGGNGSLGFTASSETYEPNTNSWSLAGSMSSARGGIALTALRGGRALAAGGCTATSTSFGLTSAQTTAEVFDSATSNWSLTDQLPNQRCGADSVLLPDGRVLVTGGFYSGVTENIAVGGPVTSAVIYDERTGAWTSAGSTIPEASQPIPVAGGKFFIAATQAGQQRGVLVSFTVGGQLFDPVTDDWTFATSTTVQVTFRQTLGGSMTPTAVPRADGDAIVLLGTANIALAFDPRVTPPPALILDSPGLSLILAGLTAVLCFWLGVAFVRARRRREPAEAA